jgi:ABC-type glycerol-3-phosphate transport system substrate-binding protein
MASEVNRPIGRRQILKAILAGAGTTALLPILQACAPAAPASPTAAPAAKPTEAPKAAEAPKPTEAPKAAEAPKPTEVAKPAPTTAAAPAKDPGVLGKINAADVKKYSGTTINLAVQQHTATDAIRALTPGFEDQTGIKVNFEQIPQQQMDQKQMTDMSTGTGAYDVIGWFLTRSTSITAGSGLSTTCARIYPARPTRSCSRSMTSSRSSSIGILGRTSCTDSRSTARA